MEELIEQFSLPKYIKGKSFADASSMIMDKFKERKDPESKRTMTEMLERLRQAQEFIKEQQNPQPQEELPQEEVLQDPSQQQLPQQPEQPQLPQQGQEFAYGGTMQNGYMSGGTMQNPYNKGGTMQNKYQIGGLMDYIGGAGGAAGGGINPLGVIQPGLDLLNQAKGDNVSTDATTAGLTGAAKGAAAGSKFGPAGLGIGVGVGAITGLFGAAKAKGRMLRDERYQAQGARADSLNTFQNGGSLLRYAPLVANAAQLATLPKAEVESLNRLGNRYKPGYVDEAALQNISRENYNNSAQALAGASGGSTSALRSNILGAGLNRNKALSNAYLKASDINRGEDRTAQQFNLGVDKTNLSQSNSENDINARNRAARANAKSSLIAGLGTGIGDIGKEEKYKDIIEKISGYNQKGKLSKRSKAKVKARKGNLKTNNFNPNILGLNKPFGLIN